MPTNELHNSHAMVVLRDVHETLTVTVGDVQLLYVLFASFGPGLSQGLKRAGLGTSGLGYKS